MIFESIGKKLAFKLSTIAVFISGFLYNKDFLFELPIYQVGKYLLILLLLFLSMFIVVTRFSFKFPLDNRGPLVQKFLFIALYVLSGIVFIAFFPLLSLYFKLVYLLLFSFGFYILLLAINIFVVSEEKGSLIPLVQPSRMVVSLAFLAVIFLGSTVIYKIQIFQDYEIISSIARFTLFLSFFYALFYSVFWYVVSGYSKVGQFTVDLARVNWVLIASFVALGQIAYLLSFVPLESYGRALILTSHAYVFLIFSQLYSRHLFVRRDGVKFVLIIVSVYFLVSFM